MNQNPYEPTEKTVSAPNTPLSPTPSVNRSLWVLPFAPLLAFTGFSLVLATTVNFSQSLQSVSSPTVLGWDSSDVTVETECPASEASTPSLETPAEIETTTLDNAVDDTDYYVASKDLTQIVSGQSLSTVMIANGADLSAKGTRQWRLMKRGSMTFVQAWRGLMLVDTNHIKVSAWRSEEFSTPVQIPVAAFKNVHSYGAITALDPTPQTETGVYEEALDEATGHVLGSRSEQRIIETATLPEADVYDHWADPDSDGEYRTTTDTD